MVGIRKLACRCQAKNQGLKCDLKAAGRLKANTKEFWNSCEVELYAASELLKRPFARTLELVSTSYEGRLGCELLNVPGGPEQSTSISIEASITSGGCQLRDRRNGARPSLATDAWRTRPYGPPYLLRRASFRFRRCLLSLPPYTRIKNSSENAPKTLPTTIAITVHFSYLSKKRLRATRAMFAYAYQSL